MLNPKQLLQTLPIDIWQEITSYLEPHEVVHLTMVCKSLQKTLTERTADSLWMPFLNRTF